MDRDTIDRIQDLDTLRAIARTLATENDLLHKRLAELTDRLAKAEGADAASLQQEIALLQQKLAARERALFAPSSEKRPHPAAEPSDSPAPRTGHGPTPQPRLPVVVETLALDEPDQVCPICGGQLEEWEGQAEESEEITVVERSFHVIKRRRLKYRGRCGCCVETAPAPARLIPGGRYSPEFAVQVAVDKYADHLPLERQVAIMARLGLDVTSATLWDQIEALARVLEPSLVALRAHVLAHPVLGMDETRWPLLHKERETWTAWTLTSPRAVVHRILESRSTASALAVLGDYSGTLMVDGYVVYPLVKQRLDALREKAGTTGRRLVISFCWAHVRRKFVECEPSHAEAAQVLALIAGLYRVEREVKALGLPEPQHLAALAEARATRSRPVVDQILAWMQAQRVLPRSAAGRAISYTLDLWIGLLRFLHDPRVPLDNNGTEREIRPLAVGRKNHYGSKSRRGTEVAALLYSLIETARLNNVDPVRYLNEATRRALAEPGTATLPWELAPEPVPGPDATAGP